MFAGRCRDRRNTISGGNGSSSGQGFWSRAMPIRHHRRLAPHVRVGIRAPRAPRTDPKTRRELSERSPVPKGIDAFAGSIQQAVCDDKVNRWCTLGEASRRHGLRVFVPWAVVAVSLAASMAILWEGFICVVMLSPIALICGSKRR